jgi:lipid II:glycine glycyltransferase (peptidoglycan interpeptide bridge formation enzyme)
MMDEPKELASRPPFVPDDDTLSVSPASSRVSPSIDFHDSIAARAGLGSRHASESSQFAAECRQFSKEEWNAILSEFLDANLYQTWTYAAVRWGAKNLTHLVLRAADAVVGAAQVVTVKLPFLPGGLAYVKWGPLWIRRGREADPLVFRELFRALRQKYAIERGFLLRVTPWEFENDELQPIPEEEGFLRNMNAQQRTAVLDLAYSMEELRGSLTRHWRSNLKRAESNGLEVLEGSTEDLLDEFAELYRQMRARKDAGWIPPIHYLPQIQRELSPGMKAHIALCRHEGQTVAGLVVSALGEKSIAWLAATGDSGLELRGSYLLQWRMIQRLKSQGVRWYDLGGINEVTHPGTAQYKLGLCGKRGRVADYLGEFEACEAWTSRVVIKGTDRFRLALIRAQQFVQERWQGRSAHKQAL